MHQIPEVNEIPEIGLSIHCVVHNDGPLCGLSPVFLTMKGKKYRK